MGNTLSEIRKNVSNRNHVPSHLKPTKKKRKPKEPKEKEKKDKVSNPISRVPLKNPAPRIVSVADEDDILVGSGPRGAFRWFKGRRYINHADQGDMNNQFMPNDQLELDRIRVLAFIIRWVLRGNILAPIENKLKEGITALNVGFGPGMWIGHYMIDTAMDYQRSQFSAVDVCDLLPPDFEEGTSDLYLGLNKNTRTTSPYDFTPIHPNLPETFQKRTTHVCASTEMSSSLSRDMYSSTLSDEYPTTLNSAHPIPFKNIANDPSTSVVERKKVLENLDFYKANVLEVALPFEDNHFDFVIQRLVATSFTVANWKRVLTELLRVTKPGGYIQLVEIDYYTFELPEEGKKWEAQLLSILQDQRQMVPRMATQLPQALKALGLTEVDSTYVSIPLGSWGLDLGVLWKNNMEMFLDATGPLLSKIAGIPQKEYKQRWREMLDTQGLKPFNNIHCAWGKKPIDGVIDWNLCPLLSAK